MTRSVSHSRLLHRRSCRSLDQVETPVQVKRLMRRVNFSTRVRVVQLLIYGMNIQHVHCRDNENESFTETIHRLERESRDLGAELDRTRGHLEDVSSERRQCQAKIRDFQEELDRSRSLASQLRSELADVRAGTVEAMQVLQKHQHHAREVSGPPKDEP